MRLPYHEHLSYLLILHFPDGLTVLMIACGSGTTRHDDLLCCVDMLLDRGVEINAYNR